MGAFRLHPIARGQQVGIVAGEAVEQPYRQRLDIEDVVLDGAGEGEMLGDRLIVKFRPEDTRHVEQVDAIGEAHPLLAAGDARPVLHLGPLAAGHPVDKGGLAGIGDADDHHPDGAPAHPLGAQPFDLFGKDRADEVLILAESLAAAAVGREAEGSFRLVVGKPQAGSRLIGRVAFVEQQDPRFAMGQPRDLGIAAGIGDAGVGQLGHKIHQTDVLFHQPAGFGHMSRKPLDGVLIVHIQPPL